MAWCLSLAHASIHKSTIESCLSIQHLSSTCPSSIHPPAPLSTHTHPSLIIYPSIHTLPTFLFPVLLLSIIHNLHTTHLSIHPPTHLFIHTLINHPTYPSMYPSICSSTHPSIIYSSTNRSHPSLLSPFYLYVSLPTSPSPTHPTSCCVSVNPSHIYSSVIPPFTKHPPSFQTCTYLLIHSCACHPSLHSSPPTTPGWMRQACV